MRDRGVFAGRHGTDSALPITQEQCLTMESLLVVTTLSYVSLDSGFSWQVFRFRLCRSQRWHCWSMMSILLDIVI